MFNIPIQIDICIDIFVCRVIDAKQFVDVAVTAAISVAHMSEKYVPIIIKIKRKAFPKQPLRRRELQLITKWMLP